MVAAETVLSRPITDFAVRSPYTGLVVWPSFKRATARDPGTYGARGADAHTRFGSVAPRQEHAHTTFGNINNTIKITE